MISRDGYGRCRQCGLRGDKHIASCRYRREWRPLRMGEYPPPGPTRTLPPVMRDDLLVAPLEVYALVHAS